ncbi:MAG TPA: 16S rRNA (cytidine(1402)-2'-O)-methyltransferase [Acidimicrobiales bacterium]|nr:16S rRNA (cytidine(1402)-2'-O)-methyltransferase [Acidimicrobiales bacterium]
MTGGPRAGAGGEGGGGGRLVLVGTPIGNLGDLPPRAVEALRDADVIACEDTRRTRALLTASGVRGGSRLVSMGSHNEAAQVGRLVERLGAGETVAVVTDAGMPGISDPGERLVAAAVEAGHEVTVVPGPTAAVAALAVSGLPAARFAFEGFLPRKGKARRQRLAELAGERRTIVVFEAPHRVQDAVDDLGSALGGDRRVAVVRELTKLHEEVWRGTLAEAAAHLAASPPRGEIVLVLDGATAAEPPGDAAVEAALRARLAEGDDKRAAVAHVAASLEVPMRRVYKVAISL